jgi:hypothetical protein
MATGAQPSPARKILIVESSFVREHLHGALKRFGYDVIESDPEDGVEALAEVADSVQLIITSTPEPFLSSGTPILYIASVVDPDLVGQCAGVLRKPFRNDALLEAVHRILEP